MNKCIIDNNEFTIINTLSYDNCLNCISCNANKGYANVVCCYDGIKKRLGYTKNNTGILYACSSKSKTTKIFKSEFEALVLGMKTFIDLSAEIREYTRKDESKRLNRVIHNLKSINTHSMQELYMLIPQEELIKNNTRDKLQIVEEIIRKNSTQAAKTFFRIAKFNLSVKAEFSIYEKLLQGDIELDKRRHNIRDVIMVVLYMFFCDFNEMKIHVAVEDFHEKVNIDFESFQVAIYHIIENMSKYTAPKTNAEIKFRIEKGVQYVVFEMTSLYLNHGEEDDIFKEGYSGELAKKISKQGKGIGMYRAKKLIELNGGTIIFEPGEKVEKIIDGISYARNKIEISLF